MRRLKPAFAAIFVACFAAGCRATDAAGEGSASPDASAPGLEDFLVVPNSTGPVQFRLCTNGSPDSRHGLNTFEIEVCGEMLLRSPGAIDPKRWRTNASLHNMLVNGAGPEPAFNAGLTVMERASGRDWQYVAVDAGAAYANRLKQFRRGILFVEPDLFILHDHLVAREPSSFQMLLHPLAATRVDEAWGSLQLELPKAGLTICAPTARGQPRNWERVQSSADRILPGTVTMRLGPTNDLSALDLLTVFTIRRGREHREYAFKLLESTSAIGARIHRDGLPTLVAFKTDSVTGKCRLAGFEFVGPVGVDVFQPKLKR